jgi:hypothetical protein
MAIKKVKENQEEVNLNGTHQLLLYADVNLLGLVENRVRRRNWDRLKTK